MNRRVIVILLFAVCATSAQEPVVKFAVIGDYGKWESPAERQVSELVHSWNPDFIITLGDNNYEDGSALTIDSNIGQYYHDFIHPYRGIFGSGASVNKFFPSAGNHDWRAKNLQPYLDYFDLPGNERYYTFTWGNIQLFCIDSDLNEPDGVYSNSVQARWLMLSLQQSPSEFKVVYFHHPPFTSGQHGNTEYMKWPFRSWGASVVLGGHDHTYERLYADSLTYFVNGLGGKSIYQFKKISKFSRFRYNGNYGAQLVKSYTDRMVFEFWNVKNELVESYTIFAKTIGIWKISNEVPKSFMLFQNYPNPFNSTSKIKMQIANLSAVKLVIYEVTGKEIETLVDKELQPGTYEAEWNAANYPSGIYCYQLQITDSRLQIVYKETKKMVLLK